MTYRELSMIDVKEVLRRRAAGQSARLVARETGMDRKTAGRYYAAAHDLALPREREATDDEVLAVLRRVQAREAPDPSAERREIAAQRARIEAWLAQKRPLRLRRIHTLLVRDHGVAASYDTLRRFAIDELGWRKRPVTVRVDDTPPGQVAQIDFGKMGLLHDAQTGRVRVLWVLVVTLVYSRYQFVWPTFEQTTSALCAGLDAAWRFFGGVPHVVVPDNMSSVVRKADALDPVLSPSFTEYAQSRGFFVDTARVRAPRDKARVENQVPYVRESWFDGETFTGLDDTRGSADVWCRDVAGARVHGTTRAVPREVFERVELAAMKPAPKSGFDVPTWTEAKVHPDHHVQVARALYSVPTRYVGRTLSVRIDRVSVRLYDKGELVKMHPRGAPGTRTTDPRDYPTGTATYATRSLDTLLAQARAKGVHVGAYAARVLDVPLPWTRMRRAQELLRLCEKYGAGRVEAVCQSALAFDVVDVTRIGRMLKDAIAPATPDASSARVVAIAAPRFARGTEHFATRSGDKERA
jgi:transposase